MKTRFIWAAMLSAAALFTFAACEPQEEPVPEVVNPKVTIAADQASLSLEGTGSVTVTLSEISEKDVAVTLGLGNAAKDGKTAVPASAARYEQAVVIAAGSTSASAFVVVDTDAVDETYQLVITLASAINADLSEENNTAYLDVVEQPSKAIAGAASWGIIGGFSDWAGEIELVKVSDNPEIWAVKNAAFGGEFKFRGNKEWGKYDLGGGVTVTPGVEFSLETKGANLKIENGCWDVTLYPTEFKAIITQGMVHKLDWEINYLGCDFIEGYESYGQLEEFIIIPTTNKKYYTCFLFDVTEEGDYAGLLDNSPLEGIAAMQEMFDEMIEYYEPEDPMDECNKGEADLLYYGQPKGKYQFVVVTVDNDGVLDGGYQYVTFEKTEDPQTTYDWGINPTLNNEWFAVWDGWVSGYEGDYYWVSGYAPGAKYIYIESYTDEELAEYWGGNLKDMFNYLQSSVNEYYASGYTPADLFTAVYEDGTFEDYSSTWGMTGLTNLYIIGFDEEGHVMDDYGMSPIDIPEGDDPGSQIEWVERTDWAINYDASIDTEDEEYTQAVVVSACDAKYFFTTIYGAGTLETYGLDAVAENEGDWSFAMDLGYTMDMLVDAGYIGSSETVPYLQAWRNLENGLEAYIFGLNDDGTFSGEWHMEPLTGLDAAAAPAKIARSHNFTASKAMKFNHAGKMTKKSVKVGEKKFSSSKKAAFGGRDAKFPKGVRK